MRSLFIIMLLVGSLGVASAQTSVEKGYASTYPSAKENAATESGETYLSTGLTACHATLPFGTLVKVTNIYNGKSVTVKINDHFCQKNYRLIDVSKAAATEIDLFNTELPMVSIEVVGFEKIAVSGSTPVSTQSATTTPAETSPIPEFINSIKNIKFPGFNFGTISTKVLSIGL